MYTLKKYARNWIVPTYLVPDGVERLPERCLVRGRAVGLPRERLLLYDPAVAQLDGHAVREEAPLVLHIRDSVLGGPNTGHKYIRIIVYQFPT